MPNDRISQLEAKLEAQRERRDAEVAALAADVAADTEGTRQITASLAGIAERIAALEQRREPGFLSYWGPAIALATLLGGLFTFILGQVTAPIERELTELRDKNRSQDTAVDTVLGQIYKNTQHLEEIDKQLKADSMRSNAIEIEELKNAEERGRIKAQADMLHEWLNNVDNKGSRKWIKEK
jgi:hypothetical protein